MHKLLRIFIRPILTGGILAAIVIPVQLTAYAHAAADPPARVATMPVNSPTKNTSANLISNRGSPAMYMNGAGYKCNSGANLVGWEKGLGVFTNEDFLIYTVNNSAQYMIQAAWCPGWGYSNTGMCIYDAGNSHPYLTLGACNFNDERDVFEYIQDGNVSQLINLWWSTYAGAGNQNGARLFDGNYIYGNSDWQYAAA